MGGVWQLAYKSALSSINFRLESSYIHYGVVVPMCRPRKGCTIKSFCRSDKLRGKTCMLALFEDECGFLRGWSCLSQSGIFSFTSFEIDLLRFWKYQWGFGNSPLNYCILQSKGHFENDANSLTEILQFNEDIPNYSDGIFHNTTLGEVSLNETEFDQVK